MSRKSIANILREELERVDCGTHVLIRGVGKKGIITYYKVYKTKDGKKFNRAITTDAKTYRRAKENNEKE